jgi:hypothetical protein
MSSILRSIEDRFAPHVLYIGAVSAISATLFLVIGEAVFPSPPNAQQASIAAISEARAEFEPIVYVPDMRAAMNTSLDLPKAFPPGALQANASVPKQQKKVVKKNVVKKQPQ